MNDELKKILGLLNFNRDTISNGTCCIEDFMSREQIIKLLDYITNLQEENEELKDKLDIFMLSNKTKQETIDKFRKRIDVVSQRIGDFRLIFNEDGVMISGADSILAKLRYYKALLDNKIPLTMTAYEYSMWEKENRKGE